MSTSASPIKAREALDLKDIALVIPLRREMAVYQMGMGCKGGYRPEHWQWKWDVNRANNQVWIGDVDAGISCKLKHLEDRWDLYNLRESGTYRDWSNEGRGGCTIDEQGPDQVVLRAYTGAEKVLRAGEELQFNFGILITPLKMLDTTTLDAFKITPPPALIICGTTARVHTNTPFRFTPTTASNCSSLITPASPPSLYFTNCPSRKMPALLTSTCTLPQRAATSSTAAPTDIVLVTSTR